MATRVYISKSARKLVDNLFQIAPLLSYIKDSYQIPEEEPDDFLEWALEVRKEAGIVDPPVEKTFKGGKSIAEQFIYGK